MTKQFRTIVEPLKLQGLITHQCGVVMMGSCFSDNIGNRLRQACFDVEVNPFGTLYNPASLACGINAILAKQQYTNDDLFKVAGDNRWHCFSHHSMFSSVDAEAMLARINKRVSEAYNALSTASVLIVTFGTAWIYELVDTHEVVANCHKLPANRFNRRIMGVDEIVSLWQNVINTLHEFNPNLKIVFTVSPIRHLRDGAHENQLSKSTLHITINQLMQQFEDLMYFPAYEIMNDDLRDYRFYASDMTHPSEVAIDYIYDIFSQSFFDKETKSLAKQCERLTRRLAHRPMSDDSEAVARFEKSTLEVKTQMLQQYPFLQRALTKLEL